MLAKLSGIADVETRARIEFRMASARGVGAQAAHALGERSQRREHVLEVRGMRAVDHVVRGVRVGFVFDALDGMRKRVA